MFAPDGTRSLQHTHTDKKKKKTLQQLKWFINYKFIVARFFSMNSIKKKWKLDTYIEEQ